MKTYDIEVQRLASARHDKGVIEIAMEVLVQARPVHGEGVEVSRLRLPVDHARTLLLLLKQRLAELDETQPRSRRSGRA